MEEHAKPPFWSQLNQSPRMQSLADQILDDSSTEGVQLLNTSTDMPTVVDFPRPEGARLQEIILRMMLKGNSPQDIAETVGKTEEAVIKVAQSEWSQKELARIAKETPDEQSSVRCLVRMSAFQAALRLNALMQSPNHNVALGACRLILEHSIAPMKEDDIDKKKKMTAETALNESARLDREIEALEAKKRKRA